MAFPVVWQKIKDIADKFSEYLPLSGGRLTGAVTTESSIYATNPDNTDIGYSWGDRSGACIGLRSASRAESAGAFDIYARTATESANLVGLPGGELKWSGDKINLGAGKYTVIQDTRSDGDDYVGTQVYGGKAGFGSGASLVLRPKESAKDAGAFQIQAHDGTNCSVLDGYPGGKLTWNFAEVSSGGKVPTSGASVSTITSGDSCLYVKRATTSTAPNNGVVLEYGNSSNLVGQLWVPDNASGAIASAGWESGSRVGWSHYVKTVNGKAADALGAVTISKAPIIYWSKTYTTYFTTTKSYKLTQNVFAVIRLAEGAGLKVNGKIYVPQRNEDLPDEFVGLIVNSTDTLTGIGRGTIYCTFAPME